MNILRHRLINSALVEAVGAGSLCTRKLTLFLKYKLFSLPRREFMKYLPIFGTRITPFFRRKGARFLVLFHDPK